MIFQISDLNALGRAPQTGDVFAIDTGTDTAKIDYNALATAILAQAVKKSGDTMTDTLNVPRLNAYYNNANGVQIWADSEGGNIAIVSPDGHEYQIDAFNNDQMRLYAYDDNDNIHAVSWYRADGTLFVDRLNVGDAQATRTNLSVYSKTETDSAIAKYMMCDTDNKQVFTFENLSLLNDTGKFKYGLLFGGEQNTPFVYHVFAAVDNTITITPILSTSNSATFTGSVSGTTLTLTGNRIVYGGVRLIWINA